MVSVRRRKRYCFGCLRGILTPKITVAFSCGEEFLKWKMENGKWKVRQKEEDYDIIHPPSTFGGSDLRAEGERRSRACLVRAGQDKCPQGKGGVND